MEKQEISLAIACLKAIALFVAIGILVGILVGIPIGMLLASL